MKAVTIVTGPLRSGTSCVTGLLAQVGFDLGRNIRVLTKPSDYNPHGHFELDLLFTINARLIVEASPDCGVLCPPDAVSLAALAAKRDSYFKLFLSKFDGNLCKDPLFCLTLSHWERHWPELKQSVYCLRHPLAVAYSMKQRYALSEEEGLDLWRIYTQRFFNREKQIDTVIFDFDAFTRSPKLIFRALLNRLGKPCEESRLSEAIDSFFNRNYVHHDMKVFEKRKLPSSIEQLYNEIVTMVDPLEI
jgi:hypothetical protein